MFLDNNPIDTTDKARGGGRGRGGRRQELDKQLELTISENWRREEGNIIAPFANLENKTGIALGVLKFIFHRVAPSGTYTAPQLGCFSESFPTEAGGGGPRSTKYAPTATELWLSEADVTKEKWQYCPVIINSNGHLVNSLPH